MGTFQNGSKGTLLHRINDQKYALFKGQTLLTRNFIAAMRLVCRIVFYILIDKAKVTYF